MSLPNSLLQVRELQAWYGAIHVLHGVHLDLPAGAITALLGANGAGKTTTLRALCGMQVRTTGSILLDGMDVTHMPTADIVRRGVAHVPDGRGTFSHLTVEDNLRLGAYTRRDKAAVAEDMDRMFGHFPRLRERRRQQAGTLSGGEQQMLAVARALMLRPRLLLLDEPSFGLAPLVVKDIFGLLRRINEAENVAILLVEQNAALALDLADTAYLIESGKVVLHGPAAQVRDNETVRRSYLGY